MSLGTVTHTATRHDNVAARRGALDFIGGILWEALVSGGAIEQVLVDGPGAFNPPADSQWSMIEGRPGIVVRAGGPNGPVRLVGRRVRSCSTGWESLSVKGPTLASNSLIEWLEAHGLLGSPQLRLGGTSITLGGGAVLLPLPLGASEGASAMIGLLGAAFAIDSVVQAQEDPIGGGVRPLLIDRAELLRNRPASLAIARASGGTASRPVVDAALIDDGGQPVVVLRGVKFFPASIAPALTAFDVGTLAEFPPAAAATALLSEIVRRAAVLLDCAPDAIGADEPLASLGIDSLIAAELHALAVAMVGREISIARLSATTSLRDIARHTADALRDDGATVRSAQAWEFAHYMNPALGERLVAARLDKVYVRGNGSVLTDSDGTEVADFVAQYGALPFGHNPPEVWSVIRKVETEGVPSFAALSIPVAATALAEDLIAVAPRGLDRAFFCSSGAEAVEAAIKLCRAATGRRELLSTTGSFHGLTLAALSATGAPSYHTGFGTPLEGFARVPYGDVAALEATIAATPGRFAAFIVEPIQGEGGIVEPPRDYLQQVARACHAGGVPLVVDEIQTGLGRTGRLFAVADAGIEPDVMTLAKALGGGVVGIGAVVYKGSLATQEFMLRHGSTFANNALACAAARQTLEILTADNGQLVRRVAERGALLKERLASLMQRHPEVIADVRGRGYLLGIAFNSGADAYRGSAINLFCQSDAFGLLLASYLLNRHGVRVAPALSAGAVLRIEPALTMPPSLFDQLLESLEALTDILARRDTRALVGHLFDASDWTVSQPKQPEAQVRAQVPIEASPATCRFAFLIHLLDENDIGQLDPGLATLKPEALARVRPLIASELKPAVLSAFPVTAPNGRVAHGELILVPRSAQELLAMPRALAAASVLEAALLASRRGAQVIGLGGFCSVVTDGGKAIFAGVPGALTTGNALTAASAARAVIAVLEQQARSPARTTAMVIGALGSIGRAVATLLAGYVSRLILVGRRERPDIAQARLNALVGDVIDDLLHNDMERRPGSITERVRREPQEFRRIHFHLTTDPTPVWSEADVVVTSTSAVGLLVDPNALARGAIVCDVSRPINVPRVVIQQRPDVTFIEGGVMVPPPPFDTGVDLGIGRDRTYACLAETMIVALESATNRCTVGQHIDLAKMRWFEAASERAGFSVAGPFANAYSR